MRKTLFSFFLLSFSLQADIIILSEVMSKEVQKKTGVYDLNAKQKAALQEWLNEKFVLKSSVGSEQKPSNKPLYLSQNLDNGKMLKLNDDSEYLIAPEDVSFSALWITPFPIQIEPSENPDYPLKLINSNNGQWVKAKQIKPPREIHHEN